ncbi:hypothetical protein BDR06DRAFT_974656 [Suillus hirtellus]|nr:hypothetical protein BDR06DRAFT_974656 [Suillus hirtellus]
MPPTSVAPDSSPPQGNPPTPLSSHTAVKNYTPQYSLSQGGGHDQDYNLPSKRLKTLQTMWNCTTEPSSEATQYLNQHMLELSPMTHQAIATRIRYQRLYSHELDLIKSILEDETEVSQSQLKGIDLQIGSICNLLQDQGVTVGSQGWNIWVLNVLTGRIKRNFPLQTNSVEDDSKIQEIAVLYQFMMDELTIVADLGHSIFAMSFEPLHYVPNNPSSCTRLQLTTQPAVAGQSHHVYLYSRIASIGHSGSSKCSESASVPSASMTSQVDSIAEISSTKVEKQLLKDFSPTKQLALAWVQKKAAIGYISEIVSQANLKFACDIETTSKVVKWVIKALSDDCKQLAQTSENFVGCQYLHISDPAASPEDCQTYMENCWREVLNLEAPFSYYLYGHEITNMLVFVLLFMNPGMEEAHIHHWYGSPNTPLQDEDMRNQMMTTPTQMLAHLAAAMILAIQRTLSGKTMVSGKVACFGMELHADYQDAVHQAILLALASPIHGPALAARLIALHGRGMKALHGAIGLDVSVKPVHNPVTSEDLEIVQQALQLADLHLQHSQASAVDYL